LIIAPEENLLEAMPEVRHTKESVSRSKAHLSKDHLHKEGAQQQDNIGNDWPDDDRDDRGLLSRKRQRKAVVYDHPIHPQHWMRPYWLGMGLFLVLFSFWVLDSLKDPILGALTGSNLERHQPPAKLFSVCTTLALVCFLEYVSHERKRQQECQHDWVRRKDEDVLESGGSWSRMDLSTSVDAATRQREENAAEEGVTSSAFAYIGLPYCLVFGLMAYVLQFNISVATSTSAVKDESNKLTYWHLIGYIFYAAIESFGSISVATFWSYANSNLSLSEAENFYGTIIAIAQIGAIFGSTMVTTHVWNNITLIIVACLIILLHILVMTSYSRRFPSTCPIVLEAEKISSQEPALWSGVYLILKHNYVLLILGVSCLYEISLTCLNYQMTLLGWSRFEDTDHDGMSFTQFMGHYGQVVNASSLLLSSLLFPFLIHRLGLRLTLRLFPTLLMIVNMIAFGALPGNLAVLFFSISLLKAMTYSIHDPSKEILYLPTSKAIKFKAKFWIDVVGARIAKAIGSTINNYAGSVDRSIRVASAPSLLSAAALWYVCYRVGLHFDELVKKNLVVGIHDVIDDPDDYAKLDTVIEEGEFDGDLSCKSDIELSTSR